MIWGIIDLELMHYSHGIRSPLVGSQFTKELVRKTAKNVGLSI